ncbi:hypothetical protein K227x_00630 [Rubripirellula lacrimiformis]|uniref:Sulfatase n=2 Tax=Rubripirellula lacrimiformis TaxID=1930273 RepID=A0A517N3H9_9BACT|nr:hypothetical protein K227x_00630 [Rubripirellula lacrimiformis]
MIAAGGCVWDRWTATNDDSSAVLRRWFADQTDSWANRFRERSLGPAGGSIELITDDAAVGQNAQCFDQVITVANEDPAEDANRPADEIEGTQLAAVIAAAVQRDSEPDPWQVMWLHSNFLAQRWDAPRSLFPIDDVELPSTEPSEEVDLIVDAASIESEAPEAIPLIFDSVDVPSVELGSSPHPDLVTAWMRTYGCQVRLIDLMIEVLLQSLQVDDPQVIVVGTSGFSLGQNGWIGHRCGPLRSPQIRLPMLLSDVGPIRLPQPAADVTMIDLLHAIGSGAEVKVGPKTWVAEAADGPIRTQSDRAQDAMTTSGWFYVRDSDQAEHLYLKPDDVEDFNDVGRLRLDVMDLLGGN